MPVFHRAVEIVANGHLGKVTRVEVGLFEGYAEPQGDPTIKDPPAGLDYDMWCGPAAKLPYAAGRHHRWWRGNRAFGGGTLMDWIGHHNDIAHWALGLDQGGPETVEAIGWEMSACPLYDTPVHYEVVSTYAGGLVISISDRHEQGTKFIGEAGWLFVTRGRMTASNPAWLDKRFELGSVVRERSTDHYRNFLEAIRSKGRPIAPVDVAHRSITPGHLGYVSHALGRKIRWDADREEVVDDAEAQLLLTSHSYREPWRLDG
jgi:predicted dehydrogenase